MQCEYPFDGQGGTLAHAWKMGKRIPQSGQVHIDMEDSIDEYNMLEIIAHEFGHLLGLAHSEVVRAIMGEQYLGDKKRIHKDDKDGLQAIFGRIKRKILQKRLSRAMEYRDTGEQVGGWNKIIVISAIISIVVMGLLLYFLLK